MGYFELTGYLLLGLGAPLALLAGVWTKPLLLLFSLSRLVVVIKVHLISPSRCRTVGQNEKFMLSVAATCFFGPSSTYVHS